MKKVFKKDRELYAKRWTRSDEREHECLKYAFH